MQASPGPYFPSSLCCYANIRGLDATLNAGPVRSVAEISGGRNDQNCVVRYRDTARCHQLLQCSGAWSNAVFDTPLHADRDQAALIAVTVTQSLLSNTRVLSVRCQLHDISRTCRTHGIAKRRILCRVSWDSAVGTVTGQEFNDRGRVGVRIPVRERILTYSYLTDRLWGHLSFVSNGNRELSLGGKAAGAWRWPVTCNQCREQGHVDLYIHYPYVFMD
jgi:hypothetical protein